MRIGSITGATDENIQFTYSLSASPIARADGLLTPCHLEATAIRTSERPSVDDPVLAGDRMRGFRITTSSSMLAFALGLVSTGVDAWAGPAPKPAQGMQESFPGCVWGEVKGREASIWSFKCGAKVSGLHLVADDSLPGFVLKDDGPDAKGRVVIRFFKKTGGEAVPSVLPAARAASPGRYTSRCALVPLPPREGNKEKLFSLEPTGAEGRAWKASQETSKMPDEPCGKLGTSYVGDRMFREMNGDATRVVFIDMGSELQMFDPSTLTSVVP